MPMLQKDGRVRAGKVVRVVDNKRFTNTNKRNKRENNMSDLKVVSKSQARRIKSQKGENIKKDLKADTIIHMLVDASGSMGSIAGATLEGFNSFIAKQKEEEAKGEGAGVLVTLTLFDTEWNDTKRWEQKMRIVRPYDAMPLNDVPVLDYDVYNPEGGTPLHDSMMQSIQHTDRVLSRVKTKNPDVLFVVITDGDDNQSKEFKPNDIKSMVTSRETTGWTFVYMGADQDSWAQTESLGFHAGNVQNYAKADIANDAFGNIAYASNAMRSTSRNLKAKGLVGESYTTSSFFADADAEKIKTGI
jgi:ribosomal protein L35